MRAYVGILEARHNRTLIGGESKVRSGIFLLFENAAKWVAGQKALNLSAGKSVLGARVQAVRVAAPKVYQCGDLRMFDHPDCKAKIVRKF